MPYEIFNRKTAYRGIPAATITKYGQLSFNKAATKVLRDNAIEKVLLLWDKERRYVAIRSIQKNDDRVFSVRYNKRGDGSGFTITSFLKHIEYNASETRVFPVTWDEDQQMFEFQISSDYFIDGGFVTSMKRKK